VEWVLSVLGLEPGVGVFFTAFSVTSPGVSATNRLYEYEVWMLQMPKRLLRVCFDGTAFEPTSSWDASQIWSSRRSLSARNAGGTCAEAVRV
jgi:hypothetical protein